MNNYTRNTQKNAILTPYEVERKAIEKVYEQEQARISELVYRVHEDHRNNIIAAMEKHGVKNEAVEMVKDGTKITHYGYPDGSWWFETDTETYDEDDDFSYVIIEALDLGLLVHGEGKCCTELQLPKQD